jgi:peptidoglycan/xylan/chitin deacetylase (PgdA/CDA1 family)
VTKELDTRRLELEWFLQDLDGNPAGREKVLNLHSKWWTVEDYARILDAAKASGTRATFAFLGRDVPHRTEVISRMVDEGHEVVTHGSRHFLFTRQFSRHDVAQDLSRCVADLRALGAGARGLWMCGSERLDREVLAGVADADIDWFLSPVRYVPADVPDGLRHVPSSDYSDLSLLYFRELDVANAMNYFRRTFAEGNNVVLRFGVLMLARGPAEVLAGWTAFLQECSGGVPVGDWEAGGPRPAIYFDASNHLGWP